ncbi:unnamed protein product [Spirodela intermedia]|uniref:Uncharacterized protein n=1 Tax=Spirodela intermedia TaxID=51605 RepID=A0A7I8IIE4_SPIIN|nr:unnamed protein product [Spirodela intermedia]CAA6657622.1 unnamed protein product [Spirodela intermedia]
MRTPRIRTRGRVDEGGHRELPRDRSCVIPLAARVHDARASTSEGGNHRLLRAEPDPRPPDGKYTSDCLHRESKSAPWRKFASIIECI